MTESKVQKIRLDKWLWAARFFKTRAVAKHAIETGKVQSDGQRCKVSRLVDVGMALTIKQGLVEKTINIIKLSDQRRGAPEAILLYDETADSIKKRMDDTERRRKFRHANPIFDHKPNKKERRQIHHFNEVNSEN